MRPPHYLPIEVIFNLLCVCRRIQATSTQSIRRAMYRRGLYYGAYDMLPDFGFWTRLCQTALLLDESQPPRPTLFTPDWLALNWHDQILSLIEGWQTMPTNPHIQLIRKQLIPFLLEDRELNTSYRRELSGLRALGLCEGNQLTSWGSRFFNENIPPNPSTPIAWEIIDDKLHIPYPPAWNLLWEVDDFLLPIDPGIYPLNNKALRLAAQHGQGQATDALLQLLKQNVSEPLLPELIQAIKDQPILKVLPGFVLEFSSPEELSALRENASLRRDLNAVLSRHHVYIDPWQADRILKRLQRLGLLSTNDILTHENKSPSSPGYLSKNEQVYLLTLMLINDSTESVLVSPPGLLAKLTQDMPATLRAAAARKVSKLYPQLAWTPEQELPPIPEIQTIEQLEHAAQQQQSIDILYQKADQYQAEHRRVTPLLIEQRGLNFYLIAYCHTRRARRTFRLDRLQLLQEPPLP